MLEDTVNKYISMRRAMGYKFVVPARLLHNFVEFAATRKETSVVSRTVMEWAAATRSTAQKRNRLLTIRRFALAMKSQENNYEIPPRDAFGRSPSIRRIPHIYTKNEIQQLLTAASKLSPANSIRPKTYTTLFALIASTGLRISEALALNIDDISEDALVIRNTKFKKNRLVPLHSSALKALGIYKRLRIKCKCTTLALFISNKGTRLSYSTAFSTFLQLMRTVGLRNDNDFGGPCLHDLRHTFAVNSLAQCQGNRAAISRHMVALSTYLGHAHISDTYWYLQATPSLLTHISQQQESTFRENK